MIKGIVHFSFPQSEDDVKADINDLRLNIVNLIPTLSIFNRTTEVVSCAGQFDTNWPIWKQVVSNSAIFHVYF